MSQPEPIDLAALWRYVTDRLKERVTLPPLWRAMEAARPIALEDDELILGFGVGAGHQSGMLLESATRNTIEQLLEAATRRRLRIRVIGGDTPADWEAVKAAQAEAVKLAQQQQRPSTAPVAPAESWDAVADQALRRLAALDHRGLASIQGRFIEEAVALFAEAYPRLMPEEAPEQEERLYSRALVRVSERVGVPAALLAYLVRTRLGS